MATGGLIMCAGGVYHVSEIVKLVAKIFFLSPALASRPSVRMLRIDGACCVQIAVRFLGGTYDVEHAVDIGLQLFVGICLEDVACSLYGLVYIGIVKRESHK